MNTTIETTGLHPASASCIEALLWLQERHSINNILDMGCGDGLLSLTAASLWKTPVLAVDISEQAVADTTANSTTHHLDTYVTPLRSDGFTHPQIRATAPYRLIIFNLLAEPIIHMLPDVKSHLGENGFCILSGVLTWKAEATETAYRNAGFSLQKHITQTPWNTFVMQKTTP